MANKTVSFRLPDSIIDAIDEHARISGKTRTDLIVEALAQVYDVQVLVPTNITIQSVQQQLDALRQQITDLEQNRADIQATLQENTVQLLAALRQVIQPLQNVTLLASHPDAGGMKRSPQRLSYLPSAPHWILSLLVKPVTPSDP